MNMMAAQINDAYTQYNNALREKMGVNAKKQALVNVIISNLPELISALDTIEYLTKTSMEDEKTIRELKAQIKELESKKKG